MHTWNNAIKTALEPLANSDKALQMQAYMRHRFHFYGIQATQRREVLKPLFTKEQLPNIADLPRIIRELWLLPEREFQMVAVDLLIKRKKQLPETFLAEVEWLIITKSWWDTVDLLASHIVAALHINHTAQTQDYISRWRVSDNIWLRRSALLYQLKFKQQTNESLLFEVIKENQADEEFFIQKAIGWALREFSKTNANSVESFIDQKNIQGLARREGLKWLNCDD
ncbi:DNA alkylation repair protein [Vibrio kanaloae]|uniref:DNA alkylation repair protein n=1 Tax=Vibrio kanaloae TaxID=170673 RepID=A0A4U1Z2T1_9VIBR|nr:DNA alkylation repair protein [Vibrio kanaloae]TKF28150.1 DNA alkylation repair protein [Vibrio kanaloae]